MNINVKKILNIVASIIVLVAVVLAVLLVGVRLVGLQVYTVLSGSMEPEFSTGSLIYVRSVDATKLKERDIITFMLDENTIATHRIVEVVPDEEDPSVIRFRTKGDANTSVDGTLIHYKNVIGTPVFSIPLLGYLSAYIQEPPGTYVAVSVGAVLLILVFLPDLFSDPENEEDKKKKKKEEKPEKKPDSSGQPSVRSTQVRQPSRQTGTTLQATASTPARTTLQATASTPARTAPQVTASTPVRTTPQVTASTPARTAPQVTASTPVRTTPQVTASTPARTTTQQVRSTPQSTVHTTQQVRPRTQVTGQTAQQVRPQTQQSGATPQTRQTQPGLTPRRVPVLKNDGTTTNQVTQGNIPKQNTTERRKNI